MSASLPLNVRKVYLTPEAKIVLSEKSYLIGDNDDVQITDSEGNLVPFSSYQYKNIFLIYPKDSSFPMTVAKGKHSMTYVV